MMNSPLTLRDMEFTRTELDLDKIRRFISNEQFMTLAVELYKEVVDITNVLSCAYRLDEQNNPRKWTRNEAILGGLMVRSCKLQVGILSQVCERHMELVFILLRCLMENLINLVYLLEGNDDRLFAEFIEYSLRTEKRLLNKIDQNIAERGYEVAIEKRMKRSIDNAFVTSSMKPGQVDETKWKPWGEKIYERAQRVGMEEIHFVGVSLPSHFVHGNWQDLIMHHLYEEEDGGFTPKPDWEVPTPQPLLSAALLAAEVNKLYLDEITPPSPDKEFVLDLIDDQILRIRAFNDCHEDFLQTEPTWGGRTRFRYAGSVKEGTTIIYGKKHNSITVSSQDYERLLSHFRGRVVDIGTSRDKPPAGSVGEWLQKNVTKTAIASYVGAILIVEGYAKRVNSSLIHFFERK